MSEHADHYLDDATPILPATSEQAYRLVTPERLEQLEAVAEAARPLMLLWTGAASVKGARAETRAKNALMDAMMALDAVTAAGPVGE